MDRDITEEELITRIRNLTIHQLRILNDVIAEFNNEETNTEREENPPTGRRSALGPNTGRRALPRQLNHAFRDINGIPLFIWRQSTY